jgi:hypothetical protein
VYVRECERLGDAWCELGFELCSRAANLGESESEVATDGPVAVALDAVAARFERVLLPPVRRRRAI